MTGRSATPNWRRELKERIKAFIEDNLGNPDLKPETIARAHFISTRYLHKLFTEDETSVCEFIRLRRLDRCRQDLSDPTLADDPVFAIAARWGFVSPSHFTRTFRAVYGNSPKQFRDYKRIPAI